MATNVETLPEPEVEPQRSPKEEEVISAIVGTEEKVERYRQHVKVLIEAASTQGLFSKVTEDSQIKNLDQESLDQEQASTNEEGKQIESDEDFARRLQEAYYRRSMQ